MECPYCGKEMRKGYIPSEGGYRLNWKTVSPFDSMVESLPLGKRMEDVTAFCCPDCWKVILDVPEIETLGDKVARMVDTLYEKMDKVAGEKETRRAEEKKESKKREKDPWE